MLKRHEIQVLLAAGHTHAKVAALSGVSLRSVERIAREPPVDSVDDVARRHCSGIGRPSAVEDQRALVAAILAEDPRLLGVELLHRARAAGYAGGKSAFYELVRTLRPRKVPFEMRFEGLAGEFSQHDFGEVDVEYLGGGRERIEFFASRLKFSRWTEVSIVPNQRVEALVRSCLDHFSRFGGIPLLAVFDRPRTIAHKWDRKGVVTEWNQTFARAMFEMGVGVELCWPYSPEQKGSAENLVGWVKGSFFKQRRFLDREDLEQQLAAWLHEANHLRESRATELTPAARIGEERQRLRPLRISPDQLALRFPLQVGPTAEVVFDTNAYSMPPDAAGFAATLFLHRDRVRIVAGRFEAVHPRKTGRKEKSVLPEHRAQQLAHVAGERGRRYLQRQHLYELGPEVVAWLTELTHRRPNLWYPEIDRLSGLLDAYGPDVLRRAIGEAGAAGLYGAEYVAHFIDSLWNDLLPKEISA